MDPALWESLKAEDDDGADEVEAILRLDQPDREIPGVRIISRFGPIVTCRVQKDAVVRTREEEGVQGFKRWRHVCPEVEIQDAEETEALPLSMVAGDVRRPPGIQLTGAGVIVGVCDWGLDYNHPNFRRRDGSTRIIALWDQRGRPASGKASHFGYGVVYGRRQINEALSQADSSALGYSANDSAHGSHVTDIAAGNSLGGGPVGIAPEADIVFVHLAERASTTRGLDNLGNSCQLLEAIDFIRRVAGSSRKFVINLSVGAHGGSHDGTSAFEVACSHLLRAAPDRFMVQSAGNYFDKGVHASGSLREGEEHTLGLIVDAADYTPNELEVWYSGDDVFSVRVESPAGPATGWVGMGEYSDVVENGDIVGRCYSRFLDPQNQANLVDLFLYPNATPGEWQVSIRADKVTDGIFHAWLERDKACPGCQTRFRAADADSYFSLGTLASSSEPLVVGAYNNHSPDREVAAFSSDGPTRDNRPKPDLVAPGVGVLAARSAPRDQPANRAMLTRKSGTSMAAPHVAGAVALCLQGAQRPLWWHEIRELILDNTEPGVAAVEHGLRHGRGYLDIARVVEAVSRLT